MTPEVAGLVLLLGQVQDELAGLLADRPDADWLRDTPAPRWTVRDQVAHLADTEEVALATLTGGDRAFARALSGHADADAFTEAGCERGRAMTPGQVLRWWRTAAAATRAAFTTAPEDLRVPWGLGMSVADFARARLMEHWAHGLDIRAALGAGPAHDAALPQVARLALASVPYAVARAGLRRPPGRTLRLALTSGAGQHEFGPADATDTVTGPLDAWCRIAVRRPRAGDTAALTATGPLAELAVRHARAYL
ncbi:maleylpyruvate isomerase family mycothiol-dependent enzyme [Actinomadura macrotermitis]|uniref:Mycothiol-dependent maleylpyruvate isomerase metal-binding domain-containing protein n=1 Tax=Actinomadura macrotermitis TaxID=2585200 RepID=A0A7K0BRE1_9ACTN|nr:maleylpyruvate isomerase family mycothiol-dependent enzyme [Actinomadura macrotermitis]MQY03739.1 hypothetical protein [Actinomadura macrotermitis]